MKKQNAYYKADLIQEIEDLENERDFYKATTIGAGVALVSVIIIFVWFASTSLITG